MKNGHKKIKLHLLVIFTLIFVALPLLAQEEKAELAGKLPPKAMVYLESGQLSAQLGKLMDSGFAGKFVKTQVYKDFTVSKLFNKLGDRIKSLEEATGFGFDLDNLRNLAGDHSALALYDIAELKFVLLTRIEQQKVMASSLWGLREKFETRKATAIGKDYWVKEDNGGRVSFAFAFHAGYLVAGTDLPNFEKTLELMGAEGDNLAASQVFANALQSVSSLDDLLLYLDLEKIAATPYWKSYWVYGNQEELQQYQTAAITLKILATELEEKRYFTLKENTAVKDADFTALVKNLPSGMDYYEFGNLTSQECLKQLEGMFSGMSGQQTTALFNSLQGAKPSSYATALKLNAGSEFESFGFFKILAFHLDQGDNFDSVAFEKQFAAMFEANLLYGDSGLLKFKPNGKGRFLDVPLLNEIKTGYYLEGDTLVLLQGYDQAPAISGANPLVDLAAGEKKSEGFWLDYANGARKITAFFDMLAKRKNWSSTNNAKFFDVSYSSLLEVLEGIKSISANASVKDNVLVEELRYNMAP
jgi:hypothetical protein